MTNSTNHDYCLIIDWGGCWANAAGCRLNLQIAMIAHVHATKVGGVWSTLGANSICSTCSCYGSVMGSIWPSHSFLYHTVNVSLGWPLTDLINTTINSRSHKCLLLYYTVMKCISLESDKTFDIWKEIWLFINDRTYF